MPHHLLASSAAVQYLGPCWSRAGRGYFFRGIASHGIIMTLSTLDGNRERHAQSQRRPCVEQYTGHVIHPRDIVHEVSPPYPRLTVSKERGAAEMTRAASA